MVPLTLAWAVSHPELAADLQASSRGLPVRVVFRHDDFETFFRQLRATRADVVLIEAPESDARLREWIARIKSLTDPPVVIVVSLAVDAESILAAFRAGTDEYLHPPLKDTLRQAMLRESERREQRGEGHRGKILGVLSVKGGCGGTTLASGAALELARLKQSVLLLDLDLNAGMTGFLTGISALHTVTDVIRNAHRLDRDCWNALVSTSDAGLHVVPAQFGCDASCGAQVDSLREVLRFVRANYDWTIADLGSCLTPGRLPYCEEMDVLYLVATMDVAALYRCAETLRDLDQAGVARTSVRVLARHAEAETEMTPGAIQRALGVGIEAIIPDDRLAVADWHGDKHPPAAGKLARFFQEFASDVAGTAADPERATESLWRLAMRVLQPSKTRA